MGLGCISQDVSFAAFATGSSTSQGYLAIYFLVKAIFEVSRIRSLLNHILYVSHILKRQVLGCFVGMK